MLVLLDVRFAFMWGLLAFALNYIPNIGSVLAAIPPILQVLVFGGLYEALVVLAGYLIVNTVFGNILEPRIMGRGLGLSTLVVFLSLIFWGWLLGPVGMLLSVPLTIIVKIALEQTSGGRSIAFLLSDVRKQVVLPQAGASPACSLHSLRRPLRLMYYDPHHKRCGEIVTLMLTIGHRA